MSEIPDAAVLIVEDERKLRFFATEVFRLEKIKAAAVADGCEAIRYFENVVNSNGRVPRVVLLDLTMPCMNGYDVYRHLASAPYAPEMIVIITSAAGDPFEPLPGPEKTLQLMKPYEVTTLIDLIRGAAPDLFSS